MKENLEFTPGISLLENIGERELEGDVQNNLKPLTDYTTVCGVINSILQYIILSTNQYWRRNSKANRKIQAATM